MVSDDATRQNGRWNGRSLIVVAAAAIVVGVVVIGVAEATQHHAPQPTPAAAGSIGPGNSAARPTPTKSEPTTPPKAPAPHLARSDPISIAIPAIEVSSKLQYLGLNPNGTMQVPPLTDSPLTNEAAWYKYSPTPGELGPSIIEGHIDSAAQGPSVFFQLGALRPGDQVQVTLADHDVAVFAVTGVRSYLKTAFPTTSVYADTPYAALRLLTCGGTFDYQTHHYLSNIVVYAHLVSAHTS